MSSDQHIPYPISRANYEEAFLLYVDGELAEAEKAAVEAFALRHPDLKEELDLLCNTKLPADDVPFENKAELLADSMKLNAVDESLLLYIDNELPEQERKSVAARLQHDEAFALQHQLLLKTKLDASEQIVYSHKDALYRRAHKRVVPAWLRVAAAVVLIAGAGTVAWLGLDDSNHIEPDVAVVIPQKGSGPKRDAQQIQTPMPEALRNADVAKNGVTNTAAPVAKTTKPNRTATAMQAPRKTAVPTFSNTHAAARDMAHAAVPVSKKITSNNLPTGLDEKAQQPALNNSIVTLKTPPAYDITDAAEKTTVPVYTAAVEHSTASGGGVKGLLRKATRFVERRTGIKAVNDDGELLVGAVALKL